MTQTECLQDDIVASIACIAQGQHVLARGVSVVNTVTKWQGRAALATERRHAGNEATTAEEVVYTVDACNVPRRCMLVTVHTLNANDCIKRLKPLRSK